MCAIAAIISKKTALSEKLLLSMNDSMKHRGPDGHGIYLSTDRKIGFGHQRLSLVDLSSNGKQPMTKHNRTIVFNGEIYNFREINKQLGEKGYSFFSHSDTETILSAFEEWGIDCLSKFNGAFAFILHDRNTQDIYIVRDRIGEKPLYYTQTNDYFLFASEIKAFMAVPGVKLTPDIDTIRTNLIFHFFADKEATYFKNISSLLPGHYMKINKKKLFYTHKYWDIQLSDEVRYVDEKQRVSKDIGSIYKLFEDAVRIRLAADCEVGSLLSGGIDSCLITAVAAKISKYPIKCFTLSKKNHIDEDSKFAKELIRSTKNLKHIQVAITDEVFSEENLDRATRYLEEPLLNKISLYVNTNYKTARSYGLKTVLNGQGSDEITCGYYNYYDYLQSNDDVFKYNNFSKFWYEQFSFKKYMPKKESLRLIDANLKKNYLPYVSKDMLNSILAFGVKTHLLNILNHEDRFSMAESVECRTVFTDYRLIEKLMKIPSKYKILDGREKYLVRKLGEKLLPKGIIKRNKMGFPNLSGNLEKLLINNIVSSQGFKKSTLLNQIFNKSVFSQISHMSLMQQWKLISLYRFEQVFF